MQNLLPLLENVLDAASEEYAQHIVTTRFQEAFISYSVQVNDLSECYRHHRIDVIQVPQLMSRFYYESVLLHVVSEILEVVLSTMDIGVEIPFPAYKETSVFSWYRINDKMKDMLTDAISTWQDITLSDLTLKLSENSGRLLTQYTTRATGEFYTPLNLANHLINISGLADNEVLQGVQIVDPSCGGGIILLLVASRAIEYSLSNDYQPTIVLHNLTQNLHGFDIQPFAVYLTRTLLMCICGSLYASLPEKQPVQFENIRLSDPLPNFLNSSFRYVIGNPPFLPTKRKYINYIEKYEKIIYGHVNLYALFVWWGVQATEESGRISFLLPQTLMSGLYFQKLRIQLLQETKLRAITRMTDRGGIVGDADQQIMAICLEKINQPEETNEDNSTVDVIVTHNGQEVEKLTKSSILLSHVIKDLNGGPIWIISDCEVDYEIANIINRDLDGKFATLGDSLVCQNGGFVWNQHVDLIVTDEDITTRPLVSSGSIGQFSFTFPLPEENPQSTRSFVSWNEPTGDKIYTKKAVLLQRITSRKTGRRIIAAITSDAFTERYPQFLVENHVNVIISDCDDLLYGALGWLNSDLSQFLFQMRNGNAQISLHDLEGLPCSLELLRRIEPYSRAIVNSNRDERSELIQKMNDFLFTHFDLSDAQKSRIRAALS